ncbi:hypothetical protein [Peptoanaerobacter stomatis]|uniref:hypothetical protein n=1 Tax=Peptoanaerobacter stomatis TaxID=796937 RepID=UPI003F9F412D
MINTQMLINESLVDKVIRLDKEINAKKKELDEAKAEIQTKGLAEMENKNIQFYQIFANSGGSCELTYKQKLEVENISLLDEIFGEIIETKIEKKVKVKYEVESKFKSALIALYTGDYKKHDIDELLSNLGLDEKQRKLALKKLKGEYVADLKLLNELGAVDNDGLEEELDIIRENKNYENILRYIDIDKIDSELLDKLKRAIYVEDTLSLGLTYEK